MDELRLKPITSDNYTRQIKAKGETQHIINILPLRDRGKYLEDHSDAGLSKMSQETYWRLMTADRENLTNETDMKHISLYFEYFPFFQIGTINIQI